MIRIRELQLTSIVNTLAASQPEVLAQISPLERKLGLVLTLFKVSRNGQTEYVY